MKIYYVLVMNSNTNLSQKTSLDSEKEQPSNSTHTFNNVEETLELTAREQGLFEQLEIRHLAYADIDLHF